MKTSFLVSSLLIFVFILLVCVGCQDAAVNGEDPDDGGKVVVPVDVDPPEPIDIEVDPPKAIDPPKLVDVKVEPPKPADNDVKKKVGPKIEFESVVVDLGEIPPKSKNPFKFKFKNVGDAPLKILNVSKVCGCTQPTWERRSYAPGESGVVKVTFTAGGTVGKVSKGLTATSNSKDASKKRVGLRVTGVIVKKVIVEPGKIKLVFNKENAGCPEIKLTSVDGKAFAVTRFYTPDNVITAAFDREAKSTEIVLYPKVDIGKLKSRMNGYIKVSTNHPECKSVQISYVATPRYRVQPRTLQLKGCDPNEPVTRELWVLSTYGEDFEVSSISSRLNCVSLEKKEKVGNRYKLTIKVTPPDNKGRRVLSDSVKINLADDERLGVSCRLYYTRKK
jgi:hypothetical protein